MDRSRPERVADGPARGQVQSVSGHVGPEHAAILSLQRAAGNRATTALIASRRRLTRAIRYAESDSEQDRKFDEIWSELEHVAKSEWLWEPESIEQTRATVRALVGAKQVFSLPGSSDDQRRKHLYTLATKHFDTYASLEQGATATAPHWAWAPPRFDAALFADASALRQRFRAERDAKTLLYKAGGLDSRLAVALGRQADAPGAMSTKASQYIPSLSLFVPGVHNRAYSDNAGLVYAGSAMPIHVASNIDLQSSEWSISDWFTRRSESQGTAGLHALAERHSSYYADWVNKQEAARIKGADPPKDINNEVLATHVPSALLGIFYPLAPTVNETEMLRALDGVRKANGVPTLPIYRLRASDGAFDEVPEERITQAARPAK